MNKSLVIAVRAAAITCALLALPLAASAQDASAEPQAPRTQGPMTVERVKSGFVVTPEVKITSFDHSTSELIGADGGWLADKMFFIGGGGYWMVNQNHDRELAYGGLVLGVSTPVDRPFSFGVKTLFGGGTATIGRSITTFNDDIRIQTPGGRPTVVVPTPIVTNVRFHDDFFVVEPQAQVAFKMSKWIRVTAGAGYRWTGHYYYHDYYYHDGLDGLSGATGSVGLQIGGGG